MHWMTQKLFSTSPISGRHLWTNPYSSSSIRPNIILLQSWCAKRTCVVRTRSDRAIPIKINAIFNRLRIDSHSIYGRQQFMSEPQTLRPQSSFSVDVAATTTTATTTTELNHFQTTWPATLEVQLHFGVVASENRWKHISSSKVLKMKLLYQKNWTC